MAKKRKTARRRKNPSKAVSVSRTKKRSFRRRKNPFSMKGGLSEMITDVAAGAVGFAASDFLLDKIGMKYTPAIGEEENLQYVGKGKWKEKSSNTEYTTEALIKAGRLSKKVFTNAGIPLVVGFAAHSLAKGKYARYIKAFAIGSMINGVIEAVEAIRKAASKKDIDPVLNGLGQGSSQYDQLALEAQKRAAAYRQNLAVAGLGEFKRAVKNNGYGR